MNKAEISSSISLAQQILTQNRINSFTVPAKKLYPFQWNWDSGFIALGYAHFNLQWAMEELRTLFSGQWKNGMLPHIIFHSEKEDSYFPNFDFWQAEQNPDAPQHPKTSGITQPPVHGFVLERLWEQNPTHPQMTSFLKEMIPKVAKLHHFFYTERDPLQEGLAYIYHPWESGRDNSPVWDDALNGIEIPEGMLPPYQRKDTSHIDSDERPSQQQYDQYVFLLELGKKHGYVGRGIFEESPFLIQDVMTNAILIRSNRALVRLGKRFGFDTEAFETWQERSSKSFANKLWNDNLGNFLSYDLKKNDHLKAVEVGCWTALFAGVASQEQAASMNEALLNLHRNNFLLCPSFDVHHPRFDSKRYWRGPIWPQMNWMIYHGLKEYGFEETAEIVKNDLLRLISKLGFFEYFEAQKEVAGALEQGYGGNHFSWTAACYMDLLLST